MPSLLQAYRHTAALFGTQRKLWVPFVCVACIESCFIGLIWLAPHPPFSALLAPPIRYVFSERVLHYPQHLWFLYHAMQHAHVAATILIGAFMTGVACAMVRQTHEHQLPSLRAALISHRVRYGRVTLLWLITWAAAGAAAAALARLPLQPLQALWLAVGANFVLQVLLVYAIPAAVFDGLIWRHALVRSVRETLRHPLATALIVLVPSAMVLACAVGASSARVAKWMMDTTPEIVLLFVVGRLVIWTVADALLTVGAAHLWWIHRLPEPMVRAAGSREAPHAPKIASAFTIAVALVFTGCSVNYNGERLLWKAQRRHDTLLKQPASATPQQVIATFAAYERVIQETPGTIWAARAQFALGSLSMLQGDLAQAEAAYQLVLQQYDAYKEVRLGALVSLAKVYETEQQWKAAAAIYKELARLHRWSRPGLEAPLALARTEERSQPPQQARAAYRRALDTYTEMLKTAPTPKVEIQINWLLAQVHDRLGNWDQAVTILRELAELRSGVNRPVVLMALAAIYETRLHDSATAAALYKQLMEEVPEDPFGKAATASYERLTRPREKGFEAFLETPVMPEQIRFRGPNGTQ